MATIPGGRPAILRRDFLFDPYHIWESRAFGADAVALLPAILSDAQLRELMALAAELDMECLLEVAHRGRGEAGARRRRAG